jgi:hypothetical protein
LSLIALRQVTRISLLFGSSFLPSPHHSEIIKDLKQILRAFLAPCFSWVHRGKSLCI